MSDLFNAGGLFSQIVVNQQKAVLKQSNIHRALYEFACAFFGVTFDDGEFITSEKLTGPETLTSDNLVKTQAEAELSALRSMAQTYGDVFVFFQRYWARADITLKEASTIEDFNEAAWLGYLKKPLTEIAVVPFDIGLPEELDRFTALDLWPTHPDTDAAAVLDDLVEDIADSVENPRTHH